MDQPTAIRNQFDTLTEAHPELGTRLEAGLLLALAGRVEPVEQDEAGFVVKWTVNGGMKYTVSMDQGYWTCNCEDHIHQAPRVQYLEGWPGKVCKHVAAVAILARIPEMVPPPTNLLDLVRRLAQAQWMPAPPLGTKTVQGKPGHPILGKDREVKKRRDLDLPGTPAKLIWDQVGDRPVACLRVNRKTSKPLVHWVSLPDQTNRGVWQLVTDAESRYREWVAELTG